jgi:HK97 family phage major capsid protein
MSIQALREKRAAKAKTLAELVSPDREWKADTDQAIYDAGMLEIDEIDAQMKRINDLNAKAVTTALEERTIEAADKLDKDSNSKVSARFKSWLKGGDAALSAADWQEIRNTMSTTTPAEGGFTVPQTWATTVLEALKAYGGMRSVADVFQTAGGNQINYPTSDGTTEIGEILAENAPATSQDVTFATKSLVAYKYSSKIVAVPWELLQDSAVDIEALVRNRLVSRLGRITNTHFTNGTGAGQPTGIVTAATVGVTAPVGNTTTTTYDALVDTMHSIDPAYRGANNKWMMHDLSVRQVRKIKDSQNRPIFVPGYEVSVPGGAPDTLLGRPIVINQDMPVMAANAKSVLFGDFMFYKIRDVMDVTLFRFSDSPYTSKGQVGFLAWMRAGGNFIDIGGAVKLLVNSAT